jgi:hypothetical protein
MKHYTIRVLIWLLRKLADDYMMTTESIGEYYSKVPKNLKRQYFVQHSFDFYRGSNKEECLDWLYERGKYKK